MNKKQYIIPCIKESQTRIRTFLDQASAVRGLTAAPDVTTTDVGVGSAYSSIGLNNDASGTVSFSNERGGFGSDSGPWESLW